MGIFEEMIIDELMDEVVYQLTDKPYPWRVVDLPDTYYLAAVYHIDVINDLMSDFGFAFTLEMLPVEAHYVIQNAREMMDE